MRIISQDQFYDIPYDRVLITTKLDDNFRDTYNICAYLTTTFDNYFLLAEYDSKEKAQKAMELLEYQYGRHYFHFPSDDEIEAIWEDKVLPLKGQAHR